MIRPPVFRSFAFAPLLLGLMSVGWSAGVTDGFVRESFEQGGPAWEEEGTDLHRLIRTHQPSTQSAHSGQRSEYLELEAGNGTYLYYSYPIGRALIIEELASSVWIKANRKGVQLLGRVVLPRESRSAPGGSAAPLTTLIRGDLCETPDRWQRLQIKSPLLLVERAQRLLRAQLRRDVDIREAYLDRLVLNVYGGPGVTSLYIDDVEVGPCVPARPALGNAAAVTPGRKHASRDTAAVVELRHDQLFARGRPFFFRSARYLGEPLPMLTGAGFNTLYFDRDADPRKLHDAADAGLWLQLALPLALDKTPAPGSSRPAEKLLLPATEGVLAWHLGDGLTSDSLDRVKGLAKEIDRSAADRGALLMADVSTGHHAFSRHVNLLGDHRQPLATTVDLAQYRLWLTQRRYMARPGTFFWTWIQTDLPREYLDLVSAREAGGPVSVYRGPQPEQIRLLTYAALSAGCRGLGFWSEHPLCEGAVSDDRLLELGLLNRELELLGPLIVSGGQPSVIAAEKPGVEVALFQSGPTRVVVPVCYGDRAQLVPEQLAVDELTIVIPGTPETASAWEIDLGGVRGLKTQRVTGGLRVTLHEFELTAIVVLTSDRSLIEALTKLAQRLQPDAAETMVRLADMTLKKVEAVNEQLAAEGHVPPDGERLLRAAWESRGQALAALKRHDHPKAFLEARRAMRPLRVLQRAHWEDAIKTLETPAASPYALSFYTLPEHWRFMREVAAAQFGGNLATAGDCESVEALAAAGWNQQQSPDVEGLDARVAVVRSGRGQLWGNCLELRVTPSTADAPPPPVSGPTVWLSSPPVHVEAGQLLRISGWLRLSKPITGSVDGAMLYDSIGGEALAVRVSKPAGWQKYVLYRPVWTDQDVQLTVGLSGVGEVRFDDLKIERVVSRGPITRAPQPPAAVGKSTR